MPRSRPIRQIENARSPAQNIGKGHNGSAMHDAIAVGEFVADSQLRFDPIA